MRHVVGLLAGLPELIVLALGLAAMFLAARAFAY